MAGNSSFQIISSSTQFKKILLPSYLNRFSLIFCKLSREIQRNKGIFFPSLPSVLSFPITMGSGDRTSKNFHLHVLNHGRKQSFRDVPKGCLAIKVGQKGEEQQRFVVPVMYFNHPLFMSLLKEAEEEYGFDQKGTISIPCHVEEFRCVQAVIDREKPFHHHHNSHHLGCFKV